MADNVATTGGKRSTTAFLFQLVIGAVVLVYLGWWGYSNGMEYVLGRFDVFDFGGQPSAFFQEPRVLLLDPVRTEDWLVHAEEDTLWPYRPREDPWRQADTLRYAEGMKRPDEDELAAREAFEIISAVSERTVDLEKYWEEALYKRGYEFKMIKEPDLLALPDGFDMLIVPGAILLSEREKNGIKDFLADGGSVLFMYLPGVRDERGNWVGYRFLSQLIGGVPSRAVEDVSGGTSFVMRGMLPITQDVAPAAHLDSYTYFGYQTFDIIEPRTTSDAYWFYPYWREDRPLGAGDNSVLAHGTYLGGRFVWFGFAPETIQGQFDNQLILDKLVASSITWLNREPVVVPRVWPSGYRSAGSVLIEAHENAELVRRTLLVAGNAGIDVDLIAPEEFNRADISFGDVPFGDLFVSTGRFDRLSELPLKDQSAWIEATTADLEENLGVPPAGLFPNDWLYNQETLEAAARWDLRYVFGEPGPRSHGAAPHTVKPRAWWIFSPNVPARRARSGRGRTGCATTRAPGSRRS